MLASRTPLIVTQPTPLTFVPITPCRVADTRGNGFTGVYGPPSMPGSGAQRTFGIAGQCGIPAAAEAVSMNLAVVGPTTGGDLRAFPAGTATPLVPSLNWPAGIPALSNAAVIAVGTAGGITFQIDGTGTVDLVIDVNGCYGPTGSLPSGTVSSSYTKTAAVDYFYPVTVTLPTGGACLTMATVQVNFSTVPTTGGPYFRIAIKRGLGSDTNDSTHGNYVQTAGTGGFNSVDMTRHTVITINPNEATQLGCYLSSTGDVNWQTGLYCRVSYLCY